MKKVLSVLMVVLLVVSLAAVVGCDQKVKQENEQLKAKVAQLDKDKADLDGKLKACEAEKDKLAKEMAAKKAPAKKAAKPAPKKK